MYYFILPLWGSIVSSFRALGEIPESPALQTMHHCALLNNTMSTFKVSSGRLSPFQIDNLLKSLVLMKPFCKYCTCFSVWCKNQLCAVVCESWLFNCKCRHNRCNSLLWSFSMRNIFKCQTVIMEWSSAPIHAISVWCGHLQYLHIVLCNNLLCKCYHSLTAEWHILS